MSNHLLIILTAGVLALAGCGKSDKGGSQSIPAKMDFAKFQQAFPSPTPEQLSSIAKASDDIRHLLYPEALAALEKLASDPALTEAQKKAVNDMIQGGHAGHVQAPHAAPAVGRFDQLTAANLITDQVRPVNAFRAPRPLRQPGRTSLLWVLRGNRPSRPHPWRQSGAKPIATAVHASLLSACALIDWWQTLARGVARQTYTRG